MRKFTSLEIRDFVSKASFNERSILRKDASWPKISIVTPSYNQGRFLERTILSVLNQNYPNLEYIIVDGGSSDESVHIIKKYEKYLTYWVSEKDNGQADAIHKGFASSTGKILAYLNSDDVYLPGALHQIADIFTNGSNLHVVYGNMYLIDENDSIAAERRLTPYIPYISRVGLLYGGFGIYQPASFWTRESYYDVGGIDVNFHHCMDNDLFARFALGGGKFQFIREYLAGFRVHQGSKTSTLCAVAARESEIVKSKYCKHDSKLFALCCLSFIRTVRAVVHIAQRDGIYLFNRKFKSEVAWIP